AHWRVSVTTSEPVNVSFVSPDISLLLEVFRGRCFAACSCLFLNPCGFEAHPAALNALAHSLIERPSNAVSLSAYAIKCQLCQRRTFSLADRQELIRDLSVDPKSDELSDRIRPNPLCGAVLFFSFVSWLLVIGS